MLCERCRTVGGRPVDRYAMHPHFRTLPIFKDDKDGIGFG